jgi:hypothetical protein
VTEKLPQGTAAWFAMVGVEIVRVAAKVGLPPGLRLSVIERYFDGAALEKGVYQGLRIEVADGTLAYRTGVRADETADVVIEVTAQTARQLNLLLSADPAYRQTLSDAASRGDFRVSGDLGALGQVFNMAHDSIVRRTV